MLQIECPAVQVNPSLAPFVEHTFCSANTGSISVSRFSSPIPAFLDKADGRKYSLILQETQALLEVYSASATADLRSLPRTARCGHPAAHHPRPVGGHGVFLIEQILEARRALGTILAPR